MAHRTPRIERNTLHDNTSAIPVGSPLWFKWLEANNAFLFHHEAGSFTARKERRKRGGWYWIAYQSRRGKLSKKYLGRSEDLTLERLYEAMQRLIGSSQPEYNEQDVLFSGFGPPPLPRHHQSLLERRALLQRLEHSIQAKLTLLTAPAGSGKTTLLAMWYAAQRERLPLFWVTLDARHNELSRFWDAIWNALLRCRGVALSTQLYSTPQMSPETVLASLLNNQPRGVLVLDDYHVITEPRIHAGLEFLLAHMPPDLHLILSSRTVPPLSLGRARMYGELVELRAEDLRLQTDEVEQFLQLTLGERLTAEEYALIDARVDGWIAGLHMMALALQGQERPGEVLDCFTGSQRSLFAYFAEEVFAQQKPDIQHFLLSTACLTRLTPALCTAVLATGNDQMWSEMLLELERANLFLVPLDEERQHYRYHALFAEFLQEKLRRSAPEQVTLLQERAARWHAQQGAWDEAIEGFLSAGEIEDACALIERYGEELIWKRGEVGRLSGWLLRVPDIGSGRRPLLDLWYAWTLLLSGKGEVSKLEALLTCLAGSASLQGDIAALRARLAAFQQKHELVVHFSQQALQLLPMERALLRADIAFGLAGAYAHLDEAYRLLTEALRSSRAAGSLRSALFASRYLAANCVNQGRLVEAQTLLAQAFHIAGVREQDRVPVTAVVHVGLAELLYERNELEAALQQAIMGVELGEQSGEIKAVLTGCCIQALIYAALKKPEHAWELLWKAEQVAIVGQVPWLHDQLVATTVQVALAQKDVGSAKRALYRLGIDDSPFPERDDFRLLLARVWLAEGRYEDVVQLLEGVYETAQEEKHLRNALLARTMQALALNELSRQKQALSFLRQALAAAETAGYRRLFLDVHDSLLVLLEHPVLRRYAARFQVVPRAETERLSKREVEVLRLVAAGLSNQEIADELCLALSTTKSHVRHLCQKLGAQSRLQAVARARELNLL